MSLPTYEEFLTLLDQSATIGSPDDSPQFVLKEVKKIATPNPHTDRVCFTLLFVAEDEALAYMEQAVYPVSFEGTDQVLPLFLTPVIGEYKNVCLESIFN